MGIVCETRKGNHTKHQSSLRCQFKATLTQRFHLLFVSGCAGFSELAADSSVFSPWGDSEEDAFNSLSPYLKEDGKTKVKIKIATISKNYTFELKKPRKFNFKTFSAIKDKEFVKKISF